MDRDQSKGFSAETISPHALDVAGWVRGVALQTAHSFPVAVVDGAGKTFAASQVQPSTNVLVQRYDQNMNLEWEAEIALPAGFRSSGQAITDQGMLIAYLHSPTEVCVPYFYGPLPGFTAVVQGGGGPPPPPPPGPPPPGPPPPAPVADVAAIAQAVIDKLTTDLGGNHNLRTAVGSLLTATLINEYAHNHDLRVALSSISPLALTGDPNGGPNDHFGNLFHASGGVFARIDETVYATLLKFLTPKPPVP